MRFRMIRGLIAIGVLSAGAAFADVSCQNILTGPQSLATLAANGNNCLVIGDKQFFNFGFLPDGNNPSAVTAGGISVNTIGTGTSLDLWGIQFGSNLGQINNLNGTGSLFLDFNLTYSVAATGGFMISDIGQYFNGSALNNAGGPVNPNTGITITEVATDHGNSGSQAISTVSLNPNDFKDPPAEASDQLTLKVGTVPTPVVRADISKDIRIDAGAGDKVTLSLIQQRFSQVPEPRDISLLLGLALVGGVALRKKFHAVC